MINNKTAEPSYSYSQEECGLDRLNADQLIALAYWQSLSTPHHLPTWDEFDLMMIPAKAIPLTHIFDAVDNGKDFRCRFWGTAMADVMGLELAGKLLSSMHSSAQFVEIVTQQMSATLTARMPRASISALDSNNKLTKLQTLLRLPLADSSGNAAHCLTCTDFQSSFKQSRKMVSSID